MKKSELRKLIREAIEKVSEQRMGAGAPAEFYFNGRLVKNAQEVASMTGMNVTQINSSMSKLKMASQLPPTDRQRINLKCKGCGGAHLGVCLGRGCLSIGRPR